MATIVIFLVFLMLVAVFSVQNAFPVTITFFFWRFEASIAIVIFLSVLCGVVAGGVLMAVLRSKKPFKGNAENDM
jgi:uncharacterized integral membrane protein